jgi:galactarate dehydratase (D-threo-forming)
MKIQTVETLPISIRRDLGAVCQHGIVRLETDAGLVGWGEISDWDVPPAFDIDWSRLGQRLTSALAGRSAFDLEQIEDVILQLFPEEYYLYSKAANVRCGVDLALHDLIGKALDQPVHNLIGGLTRGRVRVCFPIFPQRSHADVERNLARVGRKLDEGFDLFRVYVGQDVDLDVAFLRGMRDTYGQRVAIKSLDFSARPDWRTTLAMMERFSEFDFALIESPCPRSNIQGLAEFHRRVEWPISEHVYNAAFGLELIRHGAVDIFNIAPFLVGGIRPSVRLFGLARAAGIRCLIGTTQELSLGTAASAAIGGAMTNLEFPCDPTGPRLYVDDVVTAPVRYEAGHLVVPTGAGLGVTVDEEKLRALSQRFPEPAI